MNPSINAREAGNAKEYEIVSELSKYYNVLDEHQIRGRYDTTKIDCMIMIGNLPTVAIQIKHGYNVNNDDAIIAFNSESLSINSDIIRIWYTEFKITEGCEKAIKKYGVILFSSKLELLTYLSNLNIQRIETSIVLRPYQQEAINYAIPILTSGGSVMICMPTGVGKTTIALEISHHFVENYNYKILWLTRRREIIDSQFGNIKQYKLMECINALTALGKIGYKSRYRPGLYIINEAQIVEHGLPDEFDMIIVDEAHNSGASKIFKILNKSIRPKLGLSATPYTVGLEHINSVKTLFPNEYSMDLITAIEQNHIQAITFWFRSDILAAMEDARAELPWFKTVVWAEKINEAENIHKLLTERFPDLPVLRSDSECDKNCSNMNHFISISDGIIVCAQRAREGWNDPKLNCAIYMYPVKDRAVNVQMQSSSRVNRKYSGKTKAIVIDCVNRDPIKFIKEFYFGFKGKNSFRTISIDREGDTIRLLSGSTVLGYINMDEKFSNTIEPDKIKQMLYNEIFGKMSYRKLCIDFQAHLALMNLESKIIANFENYKHYAVNTDFPPNPICEYPELKWHEVFGNELTDRLQFRDLLKICRSYYKTIDPNRLKQMGNKKHEILYDEIRATHEYKHLIPEEPNVYIPEYKNKRYLFEDSFE